MAAAEPEPPQSTVDTSGIKTGPGAPLDCLPDGLKRVLNDVVAKFGEITVVSTQELRTRNHAPDSARAKIHAACKAVDFRPDRTKIAEIKQYLRTRPEVVGVDSYRDGIMHVDTNESPASPPRATTAEAPASEAVPTPPVRPRGQLGGPPAATSGSPWGQDPFAPAPAERPDR